MNSLKQELRDRYDSERSLNLFDETEHLEDGILERIINLSLLNPTVFPYQPWYILAVKSFMTKRKLSHMCKSNEKVLSCPVSLIILADKDVLYEYHKYPEGEKLLLKASFMYASKYYSVGSSLIDNFDSDAIRKYFNIESNLEIITIICLGYFKNAQIHQVNHKSYSQIVREV